MTYQEILDDIAAYQENTLEKTRFEAMLSYRTAELVATGVSIAMGSKAKFPQIYEVYSALFEKPKKAQPNKTEVLKARLLRYAELHNNKFNKERRIES